MIYHVRVEQRLERDVRVEASSIASARERAERPAQWLDSAPATTVGVAVIDVTPDATEPDDLQAYHEHRDTN